MNEDHTDNLPQCGAPRTIPLFPNGLIFILLLLGIPVSPSRLKFLPLDIGTYRPDGLVGQNALARLPPM